MGRGDKVCSRCGQIIRTFEFSLDKWVTADELWRRIDAAYPASLRRPQLRQYLRSGRLQAGLLEMIGKTERVSPVCRCTWDNEDSVRFDREGKLYLKPSSDARNPLSNPGWLVFWRENLEQLLSIKGPRTIAAPPAVPAVATPKPAKSRRKPALLRRMIIAILREVSPDKLSSADDISGKMDAVSDKRWEQECRVRNIKECDVPNRMTFKRAIEEYLERPEAFRD